MELFQFCHYFEPSDYGKVLQNLTFQISYAYTSLSGHI